MTITPTGHRTESARQDADPRKNPIRCACGVSIFVSVTNSIRRYRQELQSSDQIGTVEALAPLALPRMKVPTAVTPSLS